MKKLIFSLLTAIIAVCNTNAQSSLVATLNHEGNISAYYGINALSQAHSAAVNGDIITLSSGTFVACDITKAVTIRGAGMEYNDGVEPTRLQGDFSVNVSTDRTYILTIEGIFHSNTLSLRVATKPLFFKCRLGTVNAFYDGSSTYYGKVKDANFIHCKVAAQFYLGASNTAFFDNCVVYEPGKYYNNNDYNSINTRYYFNNCVLKFSGKSYNGFYLSYLANLRYSYLKNCIIYSTSTNTTIPNTTTMYNNISNVSCFANALNTTNTVVSDSSTLFKTWTGGDYSDEEKFDLTDEAVTKYLGSDGKQVGLYGGSLPYDPIPTQPKITKCDVAAKTTADGKLSVDIEVEGADY
ncbi:MAG: hypothetical protein IKI26_00765 [Prevotella sp.]|nr:hypothetical protein [Prevotella sp.]